MDSYRRCYRRSYWGDTVLSLPRRPAAALEAIRAVAAKQARCWDVFCWRDDGAIVFAEAKRSGKDRIRESQVAWLRAALQAGWEASDFLIVQWSLDEAAGTTSSRCKPIP